MNNDLILPVKIGGVVNLPQELGNNVTTTVSGVKIAFIKKETIDTLPDIQRGSLYKNGMTKERSQTMICYWPFSNGPIPMTGPVTLDKYIFNLYNQGKIKVEYRCAFACSAETAEALVKRGYVVTL